MALIKCRECGKEISDKAGTCPNCGCPINEKEDTSSVNKTQTTNKKVNKKIITLIGVVVLATLISFIIYNVLVVQPQKVEVQNNSTYQEAIGLLEKGKYEDGQKLLDTISEYKDVPTILEQIKWESLVYECITDIRQHLKNPDSLQVYEVAFYDGYKTDIKERALKQALDNVVKLTGEKPVCVMRSGGQNGFGGNTTGYYLFLYSESDKVYKFMGSCDTLNEEDIKAKDKNEKVIAGLINVYKDNLEQVGDVDLARIKTIIKNDSYSTIKVIE